MAWVYLTVAGLLEIVWASAMKHSEGFTKLWPTIISLIGMVASMVLLSISMKTLPLGTAYSVWTGIGAIGTAALGIYLFNEPATLLRLTCIGLILSGIIGLKITS